jgi:hypothetical protein
LLTRRVLVRVSVFIPPNRHAKSGRNECHTENRGKSYRVPKSRKESEPHRC